MFLKNRYNNQSTLLLGAHTSVRAERESANKSWQSKFCLGKAFTPLAAT
ncbi:MAG: hypothetical protein ACR2MG_18000 [Pyrinomonadaceae bacterium]